jgi:hypothetical protein
MKNNNNTRRFARYTKNLSVVTLDGVDFIKSYNTLVSVINHETKEILVLGYWSMTTSKHINYVAKQFNYAIDKQTSYALSLTK